MKFYGYFRSSSSYRCRTAFNLLGLAPKNVAVHLTRNGGEQQKHDFAVINPQKLVPALEIDRTVMTQFLAIIEYLDEVHKGGLLGATPIERAQIRAFAHITACETQPLQNLRVLQYIDDTYG